MLPELLLGMLMLLYMKQKEHNGVTFTDRNLESILGDTDSKHEDDDDADTNDSSISRVRSYNNAESDIDAADLRAEAELEALWIANQIGKTDKPLAEETDNVAYDAVMRANGIEVPLDKNTEILDVEPQE